MISLRKLGVSFLIVLSIYSFIFPILRYSDSRIENVAKALEFDYDQSQSYSVNSKSFVIELNEFNESLLNEGVVLRFDDGSDEIINIELSEDGFDSIETIKTSSQVYTTNQIIRDRVINEVLLSSNFNVKRIVNFELSNNVTKQASVESVQAKKDFFNKLGINIIPREDWGASSESLWYPQVPSTVNNIVVHHTVTNVDNSDPSNAVRFIYEMHKNRCSNNNGSYNPSDPNCDEPDELWQDIGYNYLIDQFGNIYEGRVGGNGTIGAHSPPNGGTIGISFIGDYSYSLPTGIARSSLVRLMAALSQLNGFNLSFGSSVVGHSDRNATLCPGEVLYAELPNIVNSAVNVANNTKGAFNEVSEYIDENIITDSYVSTGNTVEIVYKESDTALKNEVLNNVVNIESSKTLGEFTILEVDESYLRSSLIQVIQKDPDGLAQTRRKYTISSWDNTDINRSIPRDYDETTHWYLDKIKLPEAWKLLEGCELDDDCGGSDTTIVAVIDTGVAYEDYLYDAGSDYTLTDIGGINMEIPSNNTGNGVYNEGYDREYFATPELAHVLFVNPYDANQDLLCFLRGENSTPCNADELEKINHANDDEGHGTAVTNVIASGVSDDAPNSLVGIAHNVSIMPIKAFYPNDTSMCYDSLGNNDPDCLNGNQQYSLRSVSDSLILYYSIDHAISNGADVINMSLTGGGTDPLLQSIIDEAASLGVIVVVASGNNNDNTNNYFPAGMSNVINVGAINSNDSRSSYSNYGTSLDLVAPVGDSGAKVATQMFSCSLTDSCFNESNPDLFFDFTSATTPETFAGTSFAAPQVSAAVALLKSLDSTLSFRMVETLLKSSTTDINTKGFDNDTGWGMLNLERLINNYNNPLIEDSADDSVLARYVSSTDSYRLITMYSNTQEQTFVPAGDWNTDFGQGGDTIKSGDFNGDGAMDILSIRVDPNQNNQLVWRVSLANALTNTFLPEVTWNSAWGKSTDQVKLGDFDGDGDTDIMTLRVVPSNNNQLRWIVALSNGSNSFTPDGDWNSAWGKSSDQVKLGDFDGDGDTDIMTLRVVTSNNNQFRWIVALSNGSNAFTPTGDWNSAWGKSTDQVKLGDFDGDGDTDIMTLRVVTSNKNQFRWIVALSNGSNSFTPDGDWNSAWGKSSDQVKLGDFDGDGDTDIMTLRVVPSNNNQFRWIVALSNEVDSFTPDGDWNSESGKSTDILLGTID